MQSKTVKPWAPPVKLAVSPRRITLQQMPVESDHQTDRELGARNRQEVLDNGYCNATPCAGSNIKVIVALESAGDQFEAREFAKVLFTDPVGHKGHHRIRLPEVGLQYRSRPRLSLGIGNDFSNTFQPFQCFLVNPVCNDDRWQHRYPILAKGPLHVQSARNSCEPIGKSFKEPGRSSNSEYRK